MQSLSISWSSMLKGIFFLAIRATVFSSALIVEALIIVKKLSCEGCPVKSCSGEDDRTILNGPLILTFQPRDLCRKANNTLFHLHASTWTTNCLPNSHSPTLVDISVLDTSFRFLSALSTNMKLGKMNIIKDCFAAFAFQLSHSLELSLPHVSH